MEGSCGLVLCLWCFVFCVVFCDSFFADVLFFGYVFLWYCFPVIWSIFVDFCVVTGVIVHFCGSVFLGCDSFCFVIRVFDFVILYFCFRVLILWFSVCDLLVLLFSALWFCVIRIFVIFFLVFFGFRVCDILWFSIVLTCCIVVLWYIIIRGSVIRSFSFLWLWLWFFVVCFCDYVLYLCFYSLFTKLPFVSVISEHLRLALMNVWSLIFK